MKVQFVYVSITGKTINFSLELLCKILVVLVLLYYLWTTRFPNSKNSAFSVNYQSSKTIVSCFC